MRPGSPCVLQPASATHAAPTPPDTGRPAEVHGPRRSRRRQPVPVLEPPAGAPSASSWTAGTPPSRPGRKAHNCCLSGGTDGVSPEGPERSGGRAQRVDTPAGPPLPPTALPRHRATRICLKQVRHDPSIPRSPALSAPRADPTIAPQLAHTRCRRAHLPRRRRRGRIEQDVGESSLRCRHRRPSDVLSGALRARGRCDCRLLVPGPAGGGRRPDEDASLRIGIRVRGSRHRSSSRTRACASAICSGVMRSARRSRSSRAPATPLADEARVSHA